MLHVNMQANFLKQILENSDRKNGKTLSNFQAVYKMLKAHLCHLKTFPSNLQTFLKLREENEIKTPIDSA